jgi:hypothetical protein
MEVFELIANILTGVILASLCVMGLIGNSVTLLVLNSNREMRNQPINMYLTVLAVYDNGVLFTAFLMFCVPGIFELMGSDYQFIDPISTIGNATSLLHENVTVLNKAHVLRVEHELLHALNSPYFQEHKEVPFNQTAFEVLLRHQDSKWNSSTSVQTFQPPKRNPKKRRRVTANKTDRNERAKRRSPQEIAGESTIRVSSYDMKENRNPGETLTGKSMTLHDKETFPVIVTSKSPETSSAAQTLSSKENKVTSAETTTTSTSSTPSSAFEKKRQQENFDKKKKISDAKTSKVEKRSNVLEVNSSTSGQEVLNNKKDVKHNLYFAVSAGKKTSSSVSGSEEEIRCIEDEDKYKRIAIEESASQKRTSPSSSETTGRMMLETSSCPSFLSSITPAVSHSAMTDKEQRKEEEATTTSEIGNREDERDRRTLERIPKRTLKRTTQQQEKRLSTLLINMNEQPVSYSSRFSTSYSTNPSYSYESVMLPHPTAISLEESSWSLSSSHLPSFQVSHPSISQSPSQISQKNLAILPETMTMRRRRSRSRTQGTTTSFSTSSRVTEGKDSSRDDEQEGQEFQDDDDSQVTTYYYSKSSSSSRPSESTPLSSSTTASRVSSYYPFVPNTDQMKEEAPSQETLQTTSSSFSFTSLRSPQQEIGEDFTKSNDRMQGSDSSAFPSTFSAPFFSSSSLISFEPASQGTEDHTSMDHGDSSPDNHFDLEDHQAKLETLRNTVHDISNETENDYIYDIRVSYITFIYPLGMIAQSGSVWTTCLITAERYLAIAHPLKALTLSTKKRALCSLLIVSIISFVYNIPRFFEIHVEEKISGRPEFKQTDLRAGNVYYFWSYVVAAYLIFLYAIPLFLLSYLNTKIYQAIKKANRDRSSLSRVQDNELNIAYMLVLLVAIFVFCNLPAFVVSILEHFQPPFLNEMTNFSNFLVCFNSSVNFVVYCTFGKKFRERLVQTFCFGSRRVPRRSTPIKIRTNHKASIVAETIV